MHVSPFRRDLEPPSCLQVLMVFLILTLIESQHDYESTSLKIIVTGDPDDQILFFQWFNYLQLSFISFNHRQFVSIIFQRFLFLTSKVLVSFEGRYVVADHVRLRYIQMWKSKDPEHGRELSVSTKGHLVVLLLRICTTTSCSVTQTNHVQSLWTIWL